MTLHKIDWPLVDKNDDGIRPAGKPDECFYCRKKVGEKHGDGCGVVTKKVRMSFTFEIDVEVPHKWDEDMIHYFFNDGTWCADNAINMLVDLKKELEGSPDSAFPCLCGRFVAKFNSVTDDTPRRKIRNDQTSQD